MAPLDLADHRERELVDLRGVGVGVVALHEGLAAGVEQPPAPPERHAGALEAESGRPGVGAEKLHVGEAHALVVGEPEAVAGGGVGADVVAAEAAIRRGEQHRARSEGNRLRRGAVQADGTGDAAFALEEIRDEDAGMLADARANRPAPQRVDHRGTAHAIAEARHHHHPHVREAP